jgi:GTPase
MNRRLGPHAPAHYELRVQGHLDDSWSTWFGGMALSREDDGTTTMRGLVTDQAALHGLLAKVRDIGATLIAVMTTDTPQSQETTVQRQLHCTDHPIALTHIAP